MITKALVLAMLLTESAGNPLAVSSEDAKGLMQMTEIAVKEVNNHFGEYKQVDMFDPDTNVRYGVKLLEIYEKDSYTVQELLANYNGGSRQRLALRSFGQLAQETANYIPSVLYRADLIADYLRVCPGLGSLPFEDLVERHLPKPSPTLNWTRNKGTFERQPAGLYVPYKQKSVRVSSESECQAKRDRIRKGKPRASSPFGP